MGRKRKLWAYTHGEHGAKVRIFERTYGSALRFDYRDATGRHRPEVRPPLRVRLSRDGLVDPALERAAAAACKKRQKELEDLAGVRRASEPDYLTVGEGFRLFFDPKRAALPPSSQARKHHTDSREFWQAELGAATAWDAVKPADVEGALKRLVAKGQVPTAEKRLSNLRRVYRWLRDKMLYDLLRDPTRGIDAAELRQGYTPARPRYAPGEPAKMLDAAPQFGERFALFVALLFEAGPRGGQVRLARRSGLDCRLEPPPPAGFGPHGWLMLPGVKHQQPMLIALTPRVRAAVDAALATYLAAWEAEYQASGKDYWLVPGGRSDRELLDEPISDTAFRKLWPKLEEAAGVATLPRRRFHGARRSWVDEMADAIGLDATAHAGGWSDRDMVEGTYVSPRRYGDIERARKAREDGAA